MHVVTVGGETFQTALRRRVLDRDIFFFGTAMILPPTRPTRPRARPRVACTPIVRVRFAFVVSRQLFRVSCFAFVVFALVVALVLRGQFFVFVLAWFAMTQIV